MLEVVPADAVELPVDELGLLVVRDMIVRRTWSTYNYTAELRHDAAWRGTPGAIEAVADAIGWLWSAGMLAPKPAESSANTIIVTRRGREAAATGLDGVRALARLEAGLHPKLERRVRRQFLLGEYENAIFTAMKLVEIRVRELGAYGNEMIGTKLMTAAFREGGPLADPATVPGEVTGLMQLFAGAYAVLRNPSAHREVSFDDVAQAADAVMTASLLMRILDGVEARLGASAT